jgi:hypothetical protein
MNFIFEFCKFLTFDFPQKYHIVCLFNDRLLPNSSIQMQLGSLMIRLVSKVLLLPYASRNELVKVKLSKYRFNWK